ncbi:MAG: FHA domain-containing protein [Armatimonadota bacterium]
MNETMSLDQNKTQMAVSPDATQFSANVNCPVCETPNPPSEAYCIDCGFLLTAAPVALEEMPKPEDAGKLVTSDGAREFVLKSGENSVGRENVDILLMHNTVSRRHAKIVVQDGHAALEDLGSTNGTSVDGQRIASGEAIDIADGAELTFGSVALKYIAPLAPIDEACEEVLEEESAEQILEQVEPEPIEGEPASPGCLISKDESLRFPLATGLNTIGRKDGANTIVIPDSYVSGRHADLTVEDDVFTITDVGSTNGTCVNGVRLEPNAGKEVRAGDEITIGQKVFRIEVA